MCAAESLPLCDQRLLLYLPGYKKPRSQPKAHCTQSSLLIVKAQLPIDFDVFRWFPWRCPTSAACAVARGAVRSALECRVFLK